MRTFSKRVSSAQFKELNWVARCKISAFKRIKINIIRHPGVVYCEADLILLTVRNIFAPETINPFRISKGAICQTLSACKLHVSMIIANLH